MIWIDGRFSWPLVLAIVWATLAIVATDIVWRSVQASIVLIAGGGVGGLAVGAAIILVVGACLKKRQAAQQAAPAVRAPAAGE